MPKTMQDFTNPGATREAPGFPDAPPGWHPGAAREKARELGLELNGDHWEAIRVIQGAYMDEPAPPLRRVHGALEARFSASGGMRHLYEIFDGGPVTRGCLRAGVPAPDGAVDEGFGWKA